MCLACRGHYNISCGVELGSRVIRLSIQFETGQVSVAIETNRPGDDLVGGAFSPF